MNDAARFCLAAAYLTCAIALAQPESVNLAGQVDVARLIDLSAQRLKLNIEYDATALKAVGPVTLRLDAGLSDDELWTLTNRVLIARGFATVRVQGKSAYSVVKLAEAPGLAGPGGAGGAADEPAAGFRTAVVRAKHRPSKELTEAAAKVISKIGVAVALREGPDALIMLSDTSARVDQALALIAMIDVPNDQVHIEDVPVRNYSALQLATLVAQVNAKRELVSGEKVPGEIVPSPDGGSVLLVSDSKNSAYWKDLLASLDRRERSETVTYAPRVFAVKEVSKLIEQAVKPQGGLGAAGTGASGDERWNS